MRRYRLTVLALVAISGPGNAAREAGPAAVQHSFKLYDPLADAIFNDEKHVRKKAGKLLVDGDCAGAAVYASEKGRYDIVGAIARQCNQARHDRITATFFSGNPASSRPHPPSRAQPKHEPARPPLVAPVVVNDYSVPIRR